MNESEVFALAESHDLILQPSTIRIDESGVDFTAASAEDHKGRRWLLRMPRRESSMRSAAREKQLLDYLQDAAFEVPEWRIFSETLIAYPLLSGEPAAVIDKELMDYVWKLERNPVPQTYTESLAEVLAELHRTPEAPVETAGLPVTRAEDIRLAMESRMTWVKARYDVHPALQERWDTWLADMDLWPDYAGLLHGDLHPGHILIDDTSRVTGLIDWTEAAVGDVSPDFLTHYLLFGEEALDDLITAYEQADGRTWPGMKRHIIEMMTTSGITTAEYAEVSGLKEMHETAAAMLASPDGSGKQG
ncbi:macrolide 2'-phosphotransferase [Alkalicoccus chagannorensis]|uniref:macrolide 2'-phosphotransferase n=1 Tax=Alkalicoccus chagannorensis TaxID=427072 RepID=UPI00040D8D2D|nr:macrolide 2'-phosphotransferase [Alkalicoccus chagannorensis]